MDEFRVRDWRNNSLQLERFTQKLDLKENLMPYIEQAITINRPLNEVFRIAGNFEKSGEIAPDVMSTHQTEERPRVGVMVTQNRSTRVLNWRLDLNADITGYVPNKIVEYKGVMGRFPVEGRIEFQSGGGTTTVVERIDMRTGCLFSIFNPLLSGAVSRRTRRAQAALKKHLESGATGQAATPTDFHKQL